MSTFNDDLSADMHDPAFAAEFELATDEVRRERYAAVLNPMEHYTADDGYGAVAVRTPEELADAAMALADQEQQERLHDRIRHIDALEAENARLRAELEENAGVIRALRRQRDEAEDIIVRVRAVLDDFGRQGHHGSAAIVRRALERGE